MEKYWVLVADKARARLFETFEGNGDLIELEGWANPDGRAHGRDLQSDRPTRGDLGAGMRRYTTGPEVDPKQKSVERFAHELGEVLERGRVDHRFERLVLVAPPAFLGTLHDALGKPLRDCVRLSVDKNLTVLSPDEIRGHLPPRLVH